MLDPKHSSVEAPFPPPSPLSFGLPWHPADYLTWTEANPQGILAPGAKHTPHPATSSCIESTKAFCYIRLPTSSCLEKPKQDNFLKHSEIFALSISPPLRASQHAAAKMTSKRPQCWECQRRDSPCDGRIPICGNCSDAGMVCPGYNNARPLTWLPTGKVSRLQKVRSRGAAPTRRLKQSPALTTARASSTPERGASVASTPPRARRRKGSSITNSNIKDSKSKANSVSDTNGPNSSSGSDRSSDAGTISEASPGDSTSSLVAAATKTSIRSDDGRHEDPNGDGLLKEKDSELQLVASRAQFTSASSSSSRQIHVAHIPPDLRPEQWDFVDAIQYCTLPFLLFNLAFCFQFFPFLVYSRPCHWPMTPAALLYTIVCPV